MLFRDLTGWILLAAAIALSILAFFLMRGYLSSREEAMRMNLMSGKGDSTRVVVAKRELHTGDVISSSTVAVGWLPSDHVPGRAVYPREFNRVKNKVLNRPMASGEVLQADFVAGLVVDRFSDLLEKGQRAVSLEVASLQNSSGMLLPGDFVDLFVLLDRKPGADQKHLEPILDRVKVLAAGRQPLRAQGQSYQRLSSRDKKYSQITVGVSLAQAERLVVARDRGQMVYLLRNARDKGRIAGLHSTGDSANGGYWYHSVSVPRGERRDLAKPSESGVSISALSTLQAETSQNEAAGEPYVEH